MPTYAYACTACEHRFEIIQSFTDSSLTVCPQCEGRLRKVFNAVGVVFKGSGFYRNDSRSDSRNGSHNDSHNDSRRSSGDASSDSSSSSSESADSSAGAGKTTTVTPNTPNTTGTKKPTNTTDTRSTSKAASKSEGSAA